jgi:hypothetical protein
MQGGCFYLVVAFAAAAAIAGSSGDTYGFSCESSPAQPTLISHRPSRVGFAPATPVRVSGAQHDT